MKLQRSNFFSITFLFLFFFSTNSFSQLNPIYFGFKLCPGISAPTQDNILNKLFSSAFAPTIGVIVEKKMKERLNLETGITFLSRANHSLYYHSELTPGVLFENIWVDDIYLSVPLVLKTSDVDFYAGVGMSADFFLNSIAKVNTEQQKFEIDATNAFHIFQLSVLGKLGYRWAVKKYNKIFAELELNEGAMQLSDVYVPSAGTGLFSRFNLSINLGYEFVVYQDRRRND